MVTTRRKHSWIGLLFALLLLMSTVGCMRNQQGVETNETGSYVEETKKPDETTGITETKPVETAAVETESAVKIGPREPVKVISNDGGLDFKNIVLPKNAFTDFYAFDETHYLFVNYSEALVSNGGKADSADVNFYLIDTANGILMDIFTVKNVCYRPTHKHHVPDGLVLSDLKLHEETSTYSAPYAWKITLQDGRLHVTETEGVTFPHHETKLVSPDGVYTVYDTTDSGLGTGGIDVVYPEGATKRILNDVAKGDAQRARGYNPVQFIDDHQLLYNIMGWEGVPGYGIYNLETDEKTEFFNGYGASGYSNGYIYLTRSQSYEIVEWCRATLGGEVTKLASVKEDDGVYHVSKSRMFKLFTPNWREFFSVNSDAHLNGNRDGISISIFFAELQNNDLKGTLKAYAEVSFDCSYGQIYAIRHGSTFTSVMFVDESVQ